MQHATKLEEVLRHLLDTYGLETILEQNDITPLDILESMYEEGMLNLEDYFYLDVPKEVTDNEDNVIDLFSYWGEDD